MENAQYAFPYTRLRQKPTFTSILTELYQRLHIIFVGDKFLTISRYYNYVVLGCAAFHICRQFPYFWSDSPEGC